MTPMINGINMPNHINIDFRPLPGSATSNSSTIVS